MDKNINSSDLKAIDLLETQYKIYFESFVHYMRLSDYVKLLLFGTCIISSFFLYFGISLKLNFIVTMDITPYYIPYITILILVLGYLVIFFLDSKSNFNNVMMEFLGYRINSLFSAKKPVFEYRDIYKKYYSKSFLDLQGFIENMSYGLSFLIYIFSFYRLIEKMQNICNKCFILGAILIIIPAFFYLIYYLIKEEYKKLRESTLRHLISQEYLSKNHMDEICKE